MAISTTKQMGVRLVRELASWARAGLPFTTAAGRAERIEKCRPCTKYENGRCELCGCFMAAKTWLATAACPADKWLAAVPSTARPDVWFFESPVRMAALLAELDGWRQTRFVDAAGAMAEKGTGADCVSFIAAVMLNLGAIKEFAWPPYVTHGGGSLMLDLVIDTLDSIPELCRMADNTPAGMIPGDLILVSTGRALHHMAIYAGQNTIWHSLRRGGVQTGNVHDPLILNHLKAVYRVSYDLTT